jgi:hypothetical protein
MGSGFRSTGGSLLRKHRPERSQHQALDALNVGIQRKKVNWILDADVRSFFDQMSHEWLLKFIQAVQLRGLLVPTLDRRQANSAPHSEMVEGGSE